MLINSCFLICILFSIHQRKAARWIHSIHVPFLSTGISSSLDNNLVVQLGSIASPASCAPAAQLYYFVARNANQLQRHVDAVRRRITRVAPRGGQFATACISTSKWFPTELEVRLIQQPSLVFLGLSTHTSDRQNVVSVLSAVQSARASARWRTGVPP